MIGYFVGPVLALLISLKFTQKQSTELKRDYVDLVAKVELLEANGSSAKLQENYVKLTAKVDLLEARGAQADKEMLQKIMTTVMPIAKAVNKLNQEVGL